MGNSFACSISQKAMGSKNLSFKACHGLQYSDSEQHSMNSLNNLKKKKEAKLKINAHKAGSRRLSFPGNNDGVIRIKMVLTKEEAALLLSMLSENDNIGRVPFDFCRVIRSHEWKPSLQSIEEEDEFC